MPHKNIHRAPFHPFTWREAMLTTGGLGFVRPAPGTWGSLPPVVLVGVSMLIGLPPAAHFGLIVLVLIVFSAACAGLGRYALDRFAPSDGSHADRDPAEVVADETAGQCLPLLVMHPAVLGTPIWGSDDAIRRLVVIGVFCGLPFVWFRLFDIVKPWPCSRLEKLPRGWGILADDLMAGAYAAGTMVVCAGVYHAIIQPILESTG